MAKINFMSRFVNGKQRMIRVSADRGYANIIAAAVVPAKDPGYVVVMGETLVLPNAQENAKIYLLHEFSASDLGSLLKRLVDAQIDYRISTVYVPPDQATNMYLSHFNQSQEREQRPFLFTQTPPNYADHSVMFHLNLLRDNLQATNRNVLIPKGSPLMDQLRNMGSNSDLKDHEAPAVSVFAYGAAALIMYPTRFTAEPVDRVQTEQPLFTSKR